MCWHAQTLSSMHSRHGMTHLIDLAILCGSSIYISFVDMFGTFGIHSCHYLAGTINPLHRLKESDDVAVLSGTLKAYVTHILICNESSFHNKSVSDLLKACQMLSVFEPCNHLGPPTWSLSCLFSRG